VRNNQRRSRARRKAYVAELETKLRESENGCSQDPTTAELAKATQEVQSLKKLLYTLGLDEAFLEAFSEAQHLAAQFSSNLESITHIGSTPETCFQHIKSLSISELDTSSIVPCQKQAHELYSPFGAEIDIQNANMQLNLVDSYAIDASPPWESHDMPAIMTPLAHTNGGLSLLSPIQENSTDFSPASNGLPAQLSGSTTLCTTAFSLVLAQNPDGHSSEYLDKKLRAGYRFSTSPLEGCRIQNHVLLEVLAEIA